MVAAVADPEATDCKELLQNFRQDKIPVASEVDFHRSYVALSNTPNPFYIASHSETIDFVRANVFKTGKYYEYELSNRVAEIFEEERRRGKKEAIMLDVGGNIGWFSLLAAAQGATTVYTFEPNPQNAIRFCESLSLNRWLHDDRSQDVVQLITKGASNHIGEENFYKATQNNPGSFTFSKRSENEEVLGVLELTTLDSFAERHGWFESKPNIALFKLDVELYEQQVFEGAERLIRSRIIRKIAMEFKRQHSREARTKIIQTSMEAGYEIYMQGNWKGPYIEVTKKYNRWQDLLHDVKNNMFGENVMFRLAE